MTAANFLKVGGNCQGVSNNQDGGRLRPQSPPVKPLEYSSSPATARKRPRTSTAATQPHFSWKESPRSQALLSPPYPPAAPEMVELGQTRPLTPAPSHYHEGTSSTQFPFLPEGQKYQDRADGGPYRAGGVHPEKLPRVGASRRTLSGDWESSGHGQSDSAEGASRGGRVAERGTGGKDGDGDERKLSKAAKLLEEDMKKVASIRSFLLNFLEERDCSIKKRLVRC